MKSMTQSWELRFLHQSDGSYICKDCGIVLPSKNSAEKHSFDCSVRASYFRKFGQWLSSRFIRNYGFDRRKSSTKMLEFLYFRYLADYAAAGAMAMFLIVRYLLMVEMDGIPFSGTVPYDDSDIFMLLISLWILLSNFRRIREYKIKVIKETFYFRNRN